MTAGSTQVRAGRLFEALEENWQPLEAAIDKKNLAARSRPPSKAWRGDRQRRSAADVVVRRPTASFARLLPYVTRSINGL